MKGDVLMNYCIAQTSVGRRCVLYDQIRAVDHEFANLNLAVLGVGGQGCSINSAIPTPAHPPMKAACILFLLLHATLTSVLAEAPSGKMQRITSPDQVPEGLQKSDWQSIREAHRAWEHSFKQERDGWQARNPGQQWTTRFDGLGFMAKPNGAEWQWGLELRSYGFGAKQKKVRGKPLAVTSEVSRLSYQWDNNVREWFMNDQRGLEHGFTMERRPGGAALGAALDLVLGTRGTLKACVTADAQTVHFCDALGAPVVIYSGLKVWDARGQVLSSCFVAGPDGGLILRMEESGARYPITIDPIAQQAYLKPADKGRGGRGQQHTGDQQHTQ